MTKLPVRFAISATHQDGHQLVIALNQFRLEINIDYLDTYLVTDQKSQRSEQIVAQMAIAS
mgnify:FL=1